MGKRRGRDRLEKCSACGRSVPRDKAVSFDKRTRYSTELDSADDVSYTGFVSVYYCISCAKRLKIFEKKKRIAQARRQRELNG